MIAWSDLLAALGLVLVIEGAVHALFPEIVRRACEWLREWRSGRMRMAGFASMLIGLAMVWLARGG